MGPNKSSSSLFQDSAPFQFPFTTNCFLKAPPLLLQFFVVLFYFMGDFGTEANFEAFHILNPFFPDQIFFNQIEYLFLGPQNAYFWKQHVPIQICCQESKVHKSEFWVHIVFLVSHFFKGPCCFPLVLQLLWLCMVHCPADMWSRATPSPPCPRSPRPCCRWARSSPSSIPSVGS